MHVSQGPYSGSHPLEPHHERRGRRRPYSLGRHGRDERFTGSGYPKSVPLALARRIETAHAAGNPFKINVWSGASTGPELDGALAKADAIEFRLPYNSDPVAREKINKGQMDYFDIHLSQVAPLVWEGFLGNLDIALIEVSGITAEGALIPSSSIGNNKTWLDRADKIILEVNRWQSEALNGMHDIYYGTALPPHRVPIPLVRPTTASASRISRSTARRSSPLSRPTHRTATRPFLRRTMWRAPLPAICSNSWRMK